MILYAPAKVNLYLKVLNKRKDGYHNIETLFEKITLFDKITLRSLKKNKIEFKADTPLVPVDRESLVYRAIDAMKKEARAANGIAVSILKRIPIAAGLGGGSSDAAMVLSALNKFYRLGLPLSRLVEIGKKLGADVPFFLYDKPFAFAKGRGDEIYPLKWKLRLWHVLICLPLKVLSGDIYRIYTRRRHYSLTKRSLTNKILSPALKEPGYEDIKNISSNDLEDTVIKKVPALEEVRRALKEIGVAHCVVSGSGPTIYSLTQDREEALRIKESLIKHFPLAGKKGSRIFIAKTL